MSGLAERSHLPSTAIDLDMHVDDIRELNCGVTDPDDLTEPKAAADAPLQIAER